MSYEEKIKPLREKIDFLDNKILDLLKSRLEVVESVWNLKKEYNIKPLDEKRWHAILKNLEHKCEEREIPYTMVKNIWEEIHKTALELESKTK